MHVSTVHMERGSGVVEGRTESKNKPIEIPVQVKSALCLAFSCRSSTILILADSSVPMGFPMTLRLLMPNSEGMKRFTPTAKAASTSGCWKPTAKVPRTETTASWPSRAGLMLSTEP